MWSDLTSGAPLQGQMRIAKLKSAYNSLITRLLLVLEVLVHCLYGGYNLHRFSDALGLVLSDYLADILSFTTMLFFDYQANNYL